MNEFILHSSNFVFTIPLLIVAIIAGLEIVGAVLGISLTTIDIDINIDSASHPNLTGVFGWAGHGNVPFIIWLCILFTCFGVTGLCINFVLLEVFSTTFSQILTAPVALIAAAIPTKIFSRIIARIIPREESSVVNTSSFIGKLAVVTAGKATKTMSAEASLLDEHGQRHYMLVRPESNIEIHHGTEIILFEKVDGIWLCDIFKNNV